MMRLSERLEVRISADFAEEDVAWVVAALLAVPESLPLGELQDAERLQASAVVPATGNLAHFQERIELLRTDWRDALMGTGLEHDDWRRVLDRMLGT